MFTCWRVSDCSLAWLTTSLKCTKVSIVKQFSIVLLLWNTWLGMYLAKLIGSEIVILMEIIKHLGHDFDGNFQNAY